MDEITIYHTPDADDAFMFYALFNGKVRSEMKFKEKYDDIETLNNRLLKENLDVSAASVYAYGLISKRYYALNTGGSFGEGYGPIIVSRESYSIEKIKDLTIGVHGKLTSTYLLYKVSYPARKEIVMKFDKIIDAVKSGEVDLGLLIHEGQLTYTRKGLKKIVDLYDYWLEQTSMKLLPLGINVVNRNFDSEKIIKIKSAIQESILYALNNVDEALEFASRFGRGTDLETLRRFALQYVNERTYDMGEDGKKAIMKLLQMGYENRLLDEMEIKII